MKKLMLFLLLSLVWTTSNGQSLLNWSRDFQAGLNTYYAEAPEIETYNEGVRVVGRKNTINGQRLEIVLYNLQGDIISSISFGDDISNSTIIDYKFDSNNQLYLLIKEKIGFYKSKIIFQKYFLDGTLIWTQEIQSSDAISYTPYSIGLTNSNCIFISAYKEFNYPEFPTDELPTITIPYLYAYNQDGNLQWQREFTSAEIDHFFASKILISNETAILFSYNNTLVKVDSNNNLTLNSTVGIFDGINHIQWSSDNNIFITATTGKYKITKVDTNGSSLWANEYTTFLPSNVFADEIKSVTQDSEGYIYTTGRHYGHNYGTPTYTNADILTLKYSPSGDLLWQNRYQYGVNNADIGNFLTFKDGYLYVGGQSQTATLPNNYDYVTLKINAATGETDQVYRYDGLADGDDAVSSMCVFDNGNYAITGLSYNNSQFDWTTQYFSDGNLSVQNSGNLSALEIIPNPVAVGDYLTLNGNQCCNYKLLSSIGQIVQSGSLNTSNGEKIPIVNIKTGIYILQLTNGTETTIKKVIVY